VCVEGAAQGGGLVWKEADCLIARRWKQMFGFLRQPYAKGCVLVQMQRLEGLVGC
jgi:hypothetical protein